MSNPDNNLLTFLKKNSLFTNSPTKNGTRKSKSKSRSKDKLSESKFAPSQPQPYQQYQQQPYYEDYKPRTFIPPEQLAPLEPLPATSGNQRFVPLQTNNLRQGNNLHDSRFNSLEDFEERPRLGEARGAELRQNDIWTGLVSYSTSFQSARIESSQCLENLGVKVRNEIANINIKIENFNSRMYRVISDEFKNLRERLLFIIDESFKEAEKYIREYMKAQEEKLAGDLVKTREILQKEYTRIEAMKEEINKPTWRKTAGDIISSQLESKVEELVKKSAQMNVGKWELGDLVGYRLKDLEKDLKELVRLKREQKRET